MIESIETADNKHCDHDDAAHHHHHHHRDDLPVILHSLGDHDDDNNNDDGRPHATFIEYRSIEERIEDTLPTVRALAVAVTPKDCSRIVKALAQILPLPPAWNHLKRVKKEKQEKGQQPKMDPTTINSAAALSSSAVMSSTGIGSKLEREQLHDDDQQQQQFQPLKRARVGARKSPRKASGGDLIILLGPEAVVSRLLFVENKDSESSTAASSAQRLIQTILGDRSYDELKLESTKDDSPETTWLASLSLQTVLVPAKPPQSQAQAEGANRVWPTQFFPLKTVEYRQQQLALSKDEMTWMHSTMQSHILPHNPRLVAIVVDSVERRVVATSWDEQALQPGSENNPLATPILWAIQGVSRLERNPIEPNTNNKKQEDSSSHRIRKPQYLCTSYDLFCNYEPTIFEGMACVHSRLSRLLFCQSTAGGGSPASSSATTKGRVWQKAFSKHGIHALPGTNHHFRALEYQNKSMCQSTMALVN